MSMNVDALLAELTAHGATLTATGAKLRIEAPVGDLDADLRQALAEHKQAILGRLARAEGHSAPEPAPVIHRIPLDVNCSPTEWLAARGLRVIGGTPYFGGEPRPMLYVAAMPPAEVAA